jgi:hypothetical protein
MAATSPVNPEPRRVSIRLPGPFWIGLATVALVGVGLRIGTPLVTIACPQAVPGEMRTLVIKGDLNVKDTVTYRDTHLEVMGNVNLLRNGSLILDGCIVEIVGEYARQYRYNWRGGTLITRDTTIGGTMQNEVINDLTLNGRNFENLLDLRPGVQKYVGNSGWTQSANGLRPHDNFFMVEGVNSNDPWMAQSMMNAVMAAGDAGTMLPIDAIDEFKTQQNPRAEYGWKPGAVVNVGVKSGTNTIHGSAYAYGREQSFDARNFFEVDTNPKVPLSLVQYGASLGGVTALLAMLASCAAGITVVGIDNGFGAACAVVRACDQRARRA